MQFIKNLPRLLTWFIMITLVIVSPSTLAGGPGPQVSPQDLEIMRVLARDSARSLDALRDQYIEHRGTATAARQEFANRQEQCRKILTQRDPHVTTQLVQSGAYDRFFHAVNAPVLVFSVLMISYVMGQPGFRSNDVVDLLKAISAGLFPPLIFRVLRDYHLMPWVLKKLTANHYRYREAVLRRAFFQELAKNGHKVPQKQQAHFFDNLENAFSGIGMDFLSEDLEPVKSHQPTGVRVDMAPAIKSSVQNQVQVEKIENIVEQSPQRLRIRR